MIIIGLYYNPFYTFLTSRHERVNGETSFFGETIKAPRKKSFFILFPNVHTQPDFCVCVLKPSTFTTIWWIMKTDDGASDRVWPQIDDSIEFLFLYY
jgi:hypothetical protein